MSTGREYDIMELYRELDRERDPEKRKTLRRTILTIKNESGLTRSMRESLLKAHRNGDIEEIKDIHEFIKHKEQYGQ